MNPATFLFGWIACGWRIAGSRQHVVGGKAERQKLFSVSKDCGHDARAAASVHHGDDPEGLFIRRVGNEIFTNDDEAQRT